MCRTRSLGGGTGRKNSEDYENESVHLAGRLLILRFIFLIFYTMVGTFCATCTVTAAILFRVVFCCQLSHDGELITLCKQIW